MTYRANSISGDDFFIAPQLPKTSRYAEWELPLGPKKPELFAPLLARIIENALPPFDGKTQALVTEMVDKRVAIGQAFQSFTWEHSTYGEAENNEDCEDVRSKEEHVKFVYDGGKIKRTKKNEIF